MLTVNLLPLEEIKTLEEMHKNHPCHAPRIRAHAILLSDTGFKLKEIASIFNICRQTAATWLHAGVDLFVTVNIIIRLFFSKWKYILWQFNFFDIRLCQNIPTVIK